MADWMKGYYEEGKAYRPKKKIKSTKGGQQQKLSNIPIPKSKPKFKGNTDAIGNRTNLRAKYKKAGGKVSKAYSACGANIITGR